MDLRSIINTEAGDNSIRNRSIPETPDQKLQARRDSDQNDPAHASPDKYLSHDYRVQKITAPPTTRNYTQQHHSQRPSPPLIQASPLRELKSPSRSFSGQTPYLDTSSSAINQYLFPQTNQEPQTPERPPLQIKASLHSESYQHQNLNSNEYQTSAGQTSSSSQNSLTNASQPHLQHQQPHPYTTIPSSISTHNQANLVNLQLKESPKVGVRQSDFSHQILATTPLRISQSSSTGNTTQSKVYIPNSAPTSFQILPNSPSGCNSQKISLNKKNQSSQEERERSVSISPKTRLSHHQDESLAQLQSIDGIDQKSNKVESAVMETVESQYINVGMSSKPYSKSVKSVRRSVQPMRKRIRYSSPPVWARSIRGSDSYSATHKKSSKHHETQPKQAVISVPNASPCTQITTDGVSNGSMTTAIQPITPVADAHPSLFLGNWEECITGQRPSDHMSKVVGDFLFYNVVTRSDIGELSSLGVQIEIEAKFGDLIDKETNQPYYLPAKSECVLSENSRVGFKSNLTEHHHQKLNTFLNRMVTNARPGSSATKPRVKIDYLHRREVDQFYELPKAQHSILPAAIRERQANYHSVKVRVSRDQKTGKVLAKIIKSRVADLHIYSAQTSTPDCRISINLEMPYHGDIDELKAAGNHRNQSPNRSKDRLSYSQSYYQIDLTQVTQVVPSNQTPRAEKDHELEVEISTEAVMEQGQLAAAGKPNDYLPLVEGFLNNIRVLSRLVAEYK